MRRALRDLRFWLACFVLATSGAAALADASPPIIAHVAEAIRIETVSHQDPARFDPAPFVAFRQFLRRSYPHVFGVLHVEPVSEHSLLIRWDGSDPALAPVIFEGHYDVVPIEPGTEADWTQPPFSGAVADGFVWGRGAVDDKAAVVAMFEAMEQLLTRGFAPQRTLWFAIGHDEEIGGFEGAAKIAALLAERGVEAEYLIGEGGGVAASYPLLPDRLVAMIGLAEKTYFTLRLSAAGDGGHSSAPPRNNAIIRLARAVTALHENPFDTKLVSPVSDMFEALAPHVGGLAGFAFENQWLTASILASQLADDRMGQTMVRTTTGVTMFEAGVKENVVPQRAHATINFRLLPGDTSEQTVAEVRRIIDDPDIEIEQSLWGISPPVADKDAPGYRKVREALESVLPADSIVVPSLVTATTDTRHYASLTPNVYRARPYTLDLSEPIGVHDTNERIATSSLVEAAAFYLALIPTVSGP